MREDIRRKAQQLIAPPRIKEPSIADKIRQLSDLGVSFYPDPNLQQNGVIIEVLSTNDPACQALTELVTQLGTDLKEADGYLSTKVDRSLVPADIRRLANQTHIPEPKAFSEVNSGVFDNDIIDVEPVDDTATTARTSISNPIDVDWVLTDIGEGHGSLGITFAPGKKASSMFGPPWRRDLAIDLDRL